MTLKEKFRPLVWFNYNSFNVHQNKEKDENSIKCEAIADEFAIGFAEWFNSKEAEDLMHDLVIVGEVDINTTTKELLEIYKKEKFL
jgi:hypothetical protein